MSEGTTYEEYVKEALRDVPDYVSKDVFLAYLEPELTEAYAEAKRRYAEEQDGDEEE